MTEKDAQPVEAVAVPIETVQEAASVLAKVKNGWTPRPARVEKARRELIEALDVRTSP